MGSAGTDGLTVEGGGCQQQERAPIFPSPSLVPQFDASSDGMQLRKYVDGQKTYVEVCFFVFVFKDTSFLASASIAYT